MRKAGKPIVKEEINDTYGDYYADPNAVVEMADNNHYYSGDYEAVLIQSKLYIFKAAGDAPITTP